MGPILSSWSLGPVDRCMCVLSSSALSDSMWPHWTAAHQAPLSMGYSRQTIGVGCHFLLQGIFQKPGTEPWSLVSPAFAGRFLTTRTTWETPQYDWYLYKKEDEDMKTNRQEALSCDNRGRDCSAVVANNRMLRLASKPRKDRKRQGGLLSYRLLGIMTLLTPRFWTSSF